MSRAKNELQRTPTFMDLYQEMEKMFVKQSAGKSPVPGVISLKRRTIYLEKMFDSNSVSLLLEGSDEPFVHSHPKLQKLEEVVLQHFRLWAESAADKNGEVFLGQWKGYDSFMQQEFKVSTFRTFLKQRGRNSAVLVVHNEKELYLRDNR